MTEYFSDLIKRMRDRAGLSLFECRRRLLASQLDIEKAILLARGETRAEMVRRGLIMEDFR